MKRVLLVCTAECEELRRQLTHLGCAVSTANDGASAISIGKHASIDLAIMASTLGEMDLAETVLNLRDVKPELEIIILMDAAEDEGDLAHAVARVTPRTIILQHCDMERYLVSGKTRTPD